MRNYQILFALTLSLLIGYAKPRVPASTLCQYQISLTDARGKVFSKIYELSNTADKQECLVAARAHCGGFDKIQYRGKSVRFNFGNEIDVTKWEAVKCP